MNIPSEVGEFRQHHQANEVSRGYNGYVHGLFTAAVTLTAAGFCLAQLEQVTRAEWLIVPLMLLVSNFVEYALHRGPLHRLTTGMGMSYRIHTKQHHRYYTHDAIEFQNSRDLHMVFFPPWAPVLMLLQLGMVCWLLPASWLSLNARYLIVSMGSLYFLFYEVMHFSHHLPDSNWVTRLPGFKKMRAHHRHHHNQRYMTHECFNVTFPLFDVLLKTGKRD